MGFVQAVRSRRYLMIASSSLAMSATLSASVFVDSRFASRIEDRDGDARRPFVQAKRSGDAAHGIARRNLVHLHVWSRLVLLAFGRLPIST